MAVIDETDANAGKTDSSSKMEVDIDSASNQVPKVANKRCVSEEIISNHGQENVGENVNVDASSEKVWW